MNRLILIFLVAILPMAIQAQDFYRFIDRISGVPETGRQAVADSFTASRSVLPYIEDDTTVWFILNSPARSVAIAGDFTSWRPGPSFISVTGSHLWYLRMKFEADARVDYKFVVDGTEWIPDPKNPNTCAGGFGVNSELRMPGYTSGARFSLDPSIAHGRVLETTFFSKVMNVSRIVKIYLPPDYGAGDKKYPLILFQDGLDFFNLCNVPEILDDLIATSRISAPIAVFVPPVDREEEYSGKKMDVYTDFIIKELLPDIENRFRTEKKPERRATIGISNGGNIALYLGLRHPEVFGKIAAMSSNVQDFISRGYAKKNQPDVILYLDLGTYDIGALIPMVRNFRDVLEKKHFDLEYREWHEGHSWCNWRGHLDLPLARFFPYNSSAGSPGK